MKSSVTTLEENKVKVVVEVDETEIDKAIDVAFRKIAKEVRLPGFRPGKAPRKVLEARIGKEYARGEALNEAIPEYYRQAIIEHDVDVIAQPDVDITSGQEDGPVEFEAVVEIRPVVTVAGYDGLRVEIEPIVATDEEVEEQIDNLRSQSAERQEVDRPVQDGDYVTIDITGTQDGEAVEGLTAEDYTYRIGSGFVVDSIDDALIGAAVGDEVEFSGEHPNEEGAELEFTAVVKRVEENVLPELDDAFVAEVSEFETVEELRADTRARIDSMKRNTARQALPDKAGEALAELVLIDVPSSLVDDQVQQQVQDMAMRLAQQGIQFDQFLQMTGQDIGALMENLREPAERAAKVDLALRAVVVAEAMELTDDELQSHLDEMAPQFGQDSASLRSALEENGQLSSFRTDLLKQRAMDLVLDSVTIVDPDGHEIERSSLDEPDDDEPADEGAGGADAPDETTTAESPADTTDMGDTGDPTDGDAADADPAQGDDDK